MRLVIVQASFVLRVLFVLALGVRSVLATELAQTEKYTFGTGFFVTEQYIVTAAHVVKDKTKVLVRQMGDSRFGTAEIVATDENFDLALLRLRQGIGPPLQLASWDDLPVGIETYVLGFSHPSIHGFSPRFTAGIMNGVARSTKEKGERFQFSAEIHKGNSGGAVVAPDGSVIGVVSSKLDALKVAERTKDLPQNVNFGVKTTTLMQFLQANGLNSVKTKLVDLTVAQRPFEVAREIKHSIVFIVSQQ